MSIFQNVTKVSLIKGIAILTILAGAQGLELTKWGMFGFFLTGIPFWCFGVIASIGGVLYFLGPMIFGSEALSSARQLSRNPERMLFLYLRPFELDARNFLQLIVGASTGVLVYLTLMKGLWWPISFVPLVISISKEQSFQDAFESLGEFIAIGNPREILKPIGASRVYVDDDKWMQKVQMCLTEARLVIVRPGSGKGIQWEIEQVLNLERPDQILFYLRFRGRKKRREKAYEEFRNQLLKHPRRSIELPERLGSHPYLIFDTSWKPCFLREANSPTELARQIFSSSGDITRDRLRPILKALNIELPSRSSNLFNNFTTGFLWLNSLIAIGLVFVFIVLGVVALASFFFNLR